MFPDAEDAHLPAADMAEPTDSKKGEASASTPQEPNSLSPSAVLSTSDAKSASGSARSPRAVGKSPRGTKPGLKAPKSGLKGPSNIAKRGSKGAPQSSGSTAAELAGDTTGHAVDADSRRGTEGAVGRGADEVLAVDSVAVVESNHGADSTATPPADTHATYDADPAANVDTTAASSEGQGAASGSDVTGSGQLPGADSTATAAEGRDESPADLGDEQAGADAEEAAAAPESRGDAAAGPLEGVVGRRDGIRVVVRVRPLAQMEHGLNDGSTVRVLDDRQTLALGGGEACAPRSFTFHHVSLPESYSEVERIGKRGL